MKKKIIFKFYFFRLYFKLVAYIWNRLMPVNLSANILALIVIVVVIIPASLVSSHLFIKSIEDRQIIILQNVEII